MFKLRKKILTMATVILVGAVGLVGCNNKEDVKVAGDEKFKITLILDAGGVNDQSFNESAWKGAKEAEKEYEGVEVSYLESNGDADFLPNVETAIDNESDLIIGVGFNLTETIGEAAERYPEQKFAIVDGNYDEIAPNLQPILFNEEEAGYAAGLISAKMTNTKKVAFVGGYEIPSVTNFLVGYEKALKEIDPEIKLLTQYANSFTDAAKGKSIAQLVASNGADIIFSAGGGVNAGVFEACKELNIKAVGVDMPSNYISPETIITSALKNVGTGVKATIKDLVDGNFKGGEAKIFNLENGGVGYEETALIPEDVKAFVNDKINNK